MKTHKLVLVALVAGVVLTSCTSQPRQQITQARICDAHNETPYLDDDCGRIQGYYYDPLTSALVYRAVLGGNTTIVHNNYRMPPGYQAGNSVTLPAPVRAPQSLPNPTSITPNQIPNPAAAPTNPTTAAPIHSNQNFSAPNPTTTSNPSAPANKGSSFSSGGNSGG
jgi:hypothetical protein